MPGSPWAWRRSPSASSPTSTTQRHLLKRSYLKPPRCNASSSTFNLLSLDSVFVLVLSLFFSFCIYFSLMFVFSLWCFCHGPKTVDFWDESSRLAPVGNRSGVDGSNPPCPRVGCGCGAVHVLGVFVWSVVLLQLISVVLSAFSFFNAVEGSQFNGRGRSKAGENKTPAGPCCSFPLNLVPFFLPSSSIW